MKVVVAPQAFKGTASATVVAAAMSRGVLQAMPHSQVVEIPIADGGSGTVDALVTATGGRYVTSPAGDPWAVPSPPGGERWAMARLPSLRSQPLQASRSSAWPSETRR